MSQYLLAIDQGTSSSRAMIFDEQGAVVASAQKEFRQYFPRDGWVEHDGMEILASVRHVLDEVMAQAPAIPRAIGITNQRETTLVWDRKTGIPICPAIVWQDRRTAQICRDMVADGHEGMVTKKTGLMLDAYFSATKIKWILDNLDGARARAGRGELAFGTVDSFLLWHLTGGKVHATDVTNAARTMLFNIHSLAWDKDLLRLFEVPESLLPAVYGSDHHFGDAQLQGHKIPITAMVGDQQAAMVGQQCLQPGEVKATFGTGGFIMMNTGDQIIHSENHLLTTVAYQIKGQTSYALEGSFFSAGSAIQWLRDGLRIIDDAAETEQLARSIDNNGGVMLVPAFTGLGAPHWQPDARGTITGLTRDTGRAEIIRAALESVGYQTADLLAAMMADSGRGCGRLKVDGGMVSNGWLLQFLADIMQLEIMRPMLSEITAHGAALLAGIGAGLYDGPEDLPHYKAGGEIITPQMTANDVALLKKSWHNAIRATINMDSP